MNALECEIHCNTTIHAMKQLQWRRLQLQQGDVAAAPSPLKLHWALTERSVWVLFLNPLKVTWWVHTLDGQAEVPKSTPSGLVLKHMKLNVSDNLSALKCSWFAVFCSGSANLAVDVLRFQPFSLHILPLHWTPSLAFFSGGSPLIFSIFSMKNRIFKHKIWCQAMKLSKNVRISCLNSNGQAAGPKAERPNELRIESDPMILVKIGQSSNQRTSTH